MRYDVIIIGAGPGGIFTAYELAKRDPKLSVAVFECGNPLEKRKCPIDGKKINLSRAVLDECIDAIFDRTLRIIEDVDMSDVSTIVLVGGSTKSQRLRDNLSSAFPGVEISAVLDPDETVALGAGAVAKAVANKKELEYSDVLPLPIGVLVDEKSVEVCLQKNTSTLLTGIHL